MTPVNRRRTRRSKPHVGPVSAGILAVLAGCPALAQAILPAPTDQVQTVPSVESEPPTGTPRTPSRAPELPKSPFGLDPNIFPGIFSTPSKNGAAEQPAAPSEPGISTAPSATTPEEPVSPLDTVPGLPPGVPSAPALAAPPFLTPRYGFGTLAPFLPPSPAPPAAPSEPPTNVGLRPLRPGAIPVQANDPRAPPILILPTVFLSQGYSDNPRSTPDTLSDSITRLRGATSISVDSVRLQGQLSGALDFRKFARATDQDTLNVNLLAYGLGTVVRDHVFVDGRAAVTQLSRTGGLGFADPEIIPRSQQTQATTVSLSPIVRQSVGSYFDGELRYNLGLNMFQNGGLLESSSTAAPATPAAPTSLQNSTRNQATLSLATGRHFSFFASKLTLDAMKIDSQSAAQSTQLRAFDDLQYQFNRQFAGLARLGYENIDYPLQPAASTTGPVWTIGGRYTPFPGSHLIAHFGRQEGLYGLAGALRYEVTPSTVLLASFERNRASPQEELLNNLNSSELDAFGNVVNQVTGLPSGLVNPEFSLLNAVFRHQKARAGIRSQIGRNVFGMFAFIEHRSPLGTPMPVAGIPATAVVSDTSRGVNLNWSRSLSPRFSSIAALGYASRAAGHQKTLTANLAMTYSLSERLSAILQYQFVDVDSAIVGGTYRRNQVEIGLTRSF